MFGNSHSRFRIRPAICVVAPLVVVALLGARPAAAEHVLKVYDLRDLNAMLPHSPDTKDPTMPLIITLGRTMGIETTQVAPGVYAIAAEPGDHDKLVKVLADVRDLYREHYVVEIGWYDVPAADAPQPGDKADRTRMKGRHQIVASRRTPTPLEVMREFKYVAAMHPIVGDQVVGYEPQIGSLESGLRLTVMVGAGDEDAKRTSIDVHGEWREAHLGPQAGRAPRAAGGRPAPEAGGGGAFGAPAPGPDETPPQAPTPAPEPPQMQPRHGAGGARPAAPMPPAAPRAGGRGGHDGHGDRAPQAEAPEPPARPAPPAPPAPPMPPSAPDTDDDDGPLGEAPPVEAGRPPLPPPPPAPPAPPIPPAGEPGARDAAAWLYRNHPAMLEASWDRRPAGPFAPQPDWSAMALPQVESRSISTTTRISFGEPTVLCVVAGFREGESIVLAATIRKAEP